MLARRCLLVGRIFAEDLRQPGFDRRARYRPSVRVVAHKFRKAAIIGKFDGDVFMGRRIREYQCPPRHRNLRPNGISGRGQSKLRFSKRAFRKCVIPCAFDMSLVRWFGFAVLKFHLGRIADQPHGLRPPKLSRSVCRVIAEPPACPGTGQGDADDADNHKFAGQLHTVCRHHKWNRRIMAASPSAVRVDSSPPFGASMCSLYWRGKSRRNWSHR